VREPGSGLAVSGRWAWFLGFCESVRCGALIAVRRFRQSAAGARYAACVAI
jgi:hypothetical protein